MTKIFSWCALALPLVAFSPTIALAQTHHHGMAEVSMVLSADGAMSLALEIPAGDVLGFERDPANATEETALSDVIEILSDPTSLFEFPAAASCALVSSEASLEAEDDHAELAAAYLLHCADASAFDTFGAPGLLGAFSGVTEVELSALVNGRAVQAELSLSSPAISLR